MESPLSRTYPGTSPFFTTPLAPKITDPKEPPTSRTYHYHDIPPTNYPPQWTLLLLHGFPDFSYSWRYIIPQLINKGLRLIIPDMLGCGLTSAPTEPERICEYSRMSLVQDFKGLLDHVRAGKVASTGHVSQMEKVAELLWSGEFFKTFWPQLRTAQ